MSASCRWCGASGLGEQRGTDQCVDINHEDRANHRFARIFAALKCQKRASSDQPVTFRALDFV
jgi:hypothetical protein